jgi:hypothetical protein
VSDGLRRRTTAGRRAIEPMAVKSGSASGSFRNDLSFSGTVFHETDAKIPQVN